MTKVVSRARSNPFSVVPRPTPKLKVGLVSRLDFVSPSKEYGGCWYAIRGSVKYEYYQIEVLKQI